jgi:hypothetical protein
MACTMAGENNSRVQSQLTYFYVLSGRGRRWELLQPSSPPVTMRAGTALLNLPLRRPHPTFVETTLPQCGRLVKVPVFVEMHFQYEVGVGKFKRAPRNVTRDHRKRRPMRPPPPRARLGFVSLRCLCAGVRLSPPSLDLDRASLGEHSSADRQPPKYFC